MVLCSYFYADGGFYIGARGRSTWAQVLRQDGRVSLCIDDGDMNRVQVKGQAELMEGPPVGLPNRIDELWMERIETQNWGQAGLDYYWNVRRHEPMVGIFVKPIKITSWKGGEWANRYKHADWKL